MIASVKDLLNVSSLSFSVSLSTFAYRHDVEVQTQSQNGFMHSVQRRLCAFVCVCLFLCLFCVCFRPSTKMGSCTQYRGDFVLVFVFVCFFVFFVSVFVPAPKWVHALITEERWFHPFTSTGPITTQQVALRCTTVKLLLHETNNLPIKKRARDQSLLDVAQCNFYCKEQNKAR